MNQAADIWSLLKNRFPANEYALLKEVRNAAGYNATRSADGIAFNLWPSRGLEIEGLELKFHRQDWFKELKTPAKADAIFQFCDRWWIVAERENIVQKDEVPSPWGFIERRGDKLFTVIPAPKLDPKPITRGFVASMLKRSTANMIPIAEIESRLADARIDGGLSSTHRIKGLENEVATLTTTLKEFEEKSGLKITQWTVGNIGQAVKMITECGAQNIKNELLDLKRRVDIISENILKIVSP
jgi:hypothetical protein